MFKNEMRKLDDSGWEPLLLIAIQRIGDRVVEAIL